VEIGIAIAAAPSSPGAKTRALDDKEGRVTGNAPDAINSATIEPRESKEHLLDERGGFFKENPRRRPRLSSDSQRSRSSIAQSRRGQRPIRVRPPIAVELPDISYLPD